MRALDSHCRFRYLLVLLVIVIFGMPVLQELSGLHTTPVGLTIIVLGVLFASGRSGCRQLILPITVILPLVWTCALSPQPQLDGVQFTAVALLLFFSTGVTLNYLSLRRKIDEEALAAAASVYLLFGLACGAVYAALQTWQPGGLEFIELANSTPDLHDHVYFSFVVLTTIGFGDVVPHDALNRSMAMLEGVAGLFYMAIVISRLVSLYHSPKKNEPSNHHH